MIRLNKRLAERLGKKQAVRAAGYPVSEMARQLAAIGDKGWGGYAFYHEPLEGRFSKEQKAAYIREANACGRAEARKLLAEFGGEAAGADRPAAAESDADRPAATAASCADRPAATAASCADRPAATAASCADRPAADVRGIARRLGLTVRTEKAPAGGGHVIFAQYEEPDKITIFTDAADRGQALLEDAELRGILGGVDITSVLLAHELFHAVEFQNKDTIYTRTEKVELWRKPFSNRSRILALSEMAAMAFAGELTGLRWSPYLLDVLLLYSCSREAACALYEEILEAAGIRERTYGETEER